MKIVRTATRAEGGLTPEEQEKMKVHTAKWIARAMRTAPIDPDRIIPAIRSLILKARSIGPSLRKQPMQDNRQRTTLHAASVLNTPVGVQGHADSRGGVLQGQFFVMSPCA